MTNRLIRYASLISVIGLIAVVLPDVAVGDDYPGYQCFKTKDGVTYCSSTKVKSHAVGAKWVQQAIAHYNLRAQQIYKKPFVQNACPKGAIVYP